MKINREIRIVENLNMSPNLKNLHEFWHPWMIWKPRISYVYSMSSWGILCYCKSKIISCAFLLPLFKNFFLHRVQLNVSRSYGIFLFFLAFFHTRAVAGWLLWSPVAGWLLWNLTNAILAFQRRRFHSSRQISNRNMYTD